MKNYAAKNRYSMGVYCYCVLCLIFIIVGCDSDTSPSDPLSDDQFALPESNKQSVTQTPDKEQPIPEIEHPTASTSETVVILPDAWGHINFKCPYYLPVREGPRGLSDYEWLANSEAIILPMSVSRVGTTMASELYQINLSTNQLPIRLSYPYAPKMEYSPAPASLDGSKFAYISGLSGEEPYPPTYGFYTMVEPVTIYITDGVTEQAIKSYVPPDETPIQVKWSPDDSKLAVRVLTEDKIKLEIINLSTLESYTILTPKN